MGATSGKGWEGFPRGGNVKLVPGVLRGKAGRQVKRSFVLVCLALVQSSWAYGCYLQSDLGPARGTPFGDEALALVSRYVEPMESLPAEGVKPGVCLYKVTLSESGSQTHVTLQGPKINALGLSAQTGAPGWTKALLGALMLGSESTARRERICTDYGPSLQEVCQPVEADVALLDELARPIPDGAVVHSRDRFYLELRPLYDLHARIYSRDSSGQFFLVFPNPEVSETPNPLKAGQRYSFPESGRMLAFDAHSGTEHFFVVLSAQSLADLSSPGEDSENFSHRLVEQGLGKATGDRRYRGRGTFVVHWVLNHR